MADSALFIAWNEPKVGREGQALELFSSTLAFWTKHMEAGNIESFEPVILSRHGGDMNGFMLVRGDGPKLDEIRRSDEFLTILNTASYCIDTFGVVDGYLGDGLVKVMAVYGSVVRGG